MKISKHSIYLRPAVQAIFAAIFIYLFIRLAYPANMPYSSPLFSADPLLALSSLIFYRGSFVFSLIAVGTLIIGSAILGRIFCGWVCPVGFMADLSGRLSLRVKWLDRRFGYLQYGLLAALLISAIFTLDLLSLTDPFIVLQRSMYLLTTASGVPVVLLAIIIGSMIVPRLWCRICPVGGILGFVSIVSPFGRTTDPRCTGCMKCKSTCAMGAISQHNVWDATACTKCLSCERICPEGAISFDPSKPVPEISPSRRSVLAAGAFLGLFAISKSVASAQNSNTTLIRPPGSIAEDTFNATCIRCESCVKACPGPVIRSAPLDAGLECMFTPMLVFGTAHCVRCGTCGTVCPSGAILKEPADRIKQIKVGTAIIDTGRCIPWQRGEQCLICTSLCPNQAVIGAVSLQPRVHGNACVGCGICELNCPVPGKAIVVTNSGERRQDAY